MQRGLAYAALFLVGMVLLKDGTIPGLFQDAAKAGGDFAKGIQPLTKVA